MVDQTTTQAEKDRVLAKKMGRVPLLRNAGENDTAYSARLRQSPKTIPDLTDEQIKLARDMHAVHSAMARGYILPPLPITDEQKAADDAWAQERGVQPVLRDPGETDAEYSLRLDASPAIVKETARDETTYPSHVDRPIFAPVANGSHEDAHTA